MAQIWDANSAKLFLSGPLTSLSLFRLDTIAG